jgi:hypothetical protein
MPPADQSAAFCPTCGHLLANDDVVKIVGRHMDGVDPTFRCPVCDGEITHPSRAPEEAEVHESEAPGRDEPGHVAHGRSGVNANSDHKSRTIVDGGPPIDLTRVRKRDRITVHYDAPGRTALQTASGTVVDPDGTPGVAFETDTRRRYRLVAGTGVLSESEERLGIASKVRVTRRPV